MARSVEPAEPRTPPRRGSFVPESRYQNELRRGPIARAASRRTGPVRRSATPVGARPPAARRMRRVPSGDDPAGSWPGEQHSSTVKPRRIRQECSARTCSSRPRSTRAAWAARAVRDLERAERAEDLVGPTTSSLASPAPGLDELGRLAVARVHAVGGVTRTLTCAVSRRYDRAATTGCGGFPARRVLVGAGLPDRSPARHPGSADPRDRRRGRCQARTACRAPLRRWPCRAGGNNPTPPSRWGRCRQAATGRRRVARWQPGRLWGPG